MVSISRGVTFSDDGSAGSQTVTVGNLTALVYSAVATGFAVNEFLNTTDTNKSIVTHKEDAATGPTTTQTSGTTWYDEANDFVRVQQGFRYDGQFDYIHIANNSATVTIPQGAVVRPVGLLANTYLPKVEMTNTQAHPDTLGISLADIAPSGLGLAVKAGFRECLVYGTVTAGDLLVTTTQYTGALESILNVSGYPTITFGLAVAQCLRSLDGTVSPTLATCMVIF